MTNVPQEGKFFILERLHVHPNYDRNDTLGKGLGFILAVETVPVTLGVVAAVVTVPVGVMFSAVGVVNWIARRQSFLAITPVKETLGVVTNFIALVVHEDIPAVDRRGAVLPGVDTERTVISIEVTSMSVAFLIAAAVSCFLVAPVLHAPLLLALLVQVNWTLGSHRVRSSKDSTSTVGVVDLAVLTGPFRWAVAGVITN